MINKNLSDHNQVVTESQSWLSEREASGENLVVVLTILANIVFAQKFLGFAKITSNDCTLWHIAANIQHLVEILWTISRFSLRWWQQVGEKLIEFSRRLNDAFGIIVSPT